MHEAFTPAADEMLTTQPGPLAGVEPVASVVRSCLQRKYAESMLVRTF